MAPTNPHPLTGTLGLALPAEAVVRTAQQGLSADHPTEGWRLTAFQRPATAGTSPVQLHGAVLGSLAKRYPDAAAASPAVSVAGQGWQGLRSVLNRPEGRELRVLTVLEPAAVLVGVVLDAPATAPASLQPESWLQSALTPTKSALSLAPLDDKTPAPMAPAKPVLSLAPLDGKDAPVTAKSTKLALSLEPIDGETPPAAAPTQSPPATPPSRASFALASVDPASAAVAPETGAARLRFGAREPSAGPIASSLQPVAPPMPATNPYQSPETMALETDTDTNHEALKAAGRGQQILIWCVLLNIAARGLYRNPEIPMLLNWMVAVALIAWAFHGVLLIASGFGYGRGAKLGLLFGSTVPLLGIGLWIWLSMKTTRALKAAGYTVGFFGVKS